MLKKLTTLIVYVGDMERSVPFYRDVLGLPMQAESPGWSQFDLGNGAVLGLHRSGVEARDRRPGWIPGFAVDDLKATRQELVAAGATISQEFHDIPGGVVLEFLDPDGNHISAAQEGVSCADLGVVSS